MFNEECLQDSLKEYKELLKTKELEAKVSEELGEEEKMKLAKKLSYKLNI